MRLPVSCCRSVSGDIFSGWVYQDELLDELDMVGATLVEFPHEPAG